MHGDLMHGDRSTQICSRPVSMGGVGCITTNSTHGIYSVSLPLSSKQDATMTGVCLQKITSPLPLYPLQGKVENDIQSGWQQQGGDGTQLPSLPPHIGGPIDFMIGIKYLRYFPTFVRINQD